MEREVTVALPPATQHKCLKGIWARTRRAERRPEARHQRVQWKSTLSHVSHMRKRATQEHLCTSESETGGPQARVTESDQEEHYKQGSVETWVWKSQPQQKYFPLSLGLTHPRRCCPSHLYESSSWYQLAPPVVKESDWSILSVTKTNHLPTFTGEGLTFPNVFIGSQQRSAETSIQSKNCDFI